MSVLFERKVVDNILTWIDDHRIICLLGARQVGKTSIMKLIQNKIKQNSLFFDLELNNYLEILNNGPEYFYTYLKTLDIDENKQTIIFIDEIQYLNNPSSILKYLHDHYRNLKLIVSGSSTLEIRKKFSDSLTGRKIVFEIQPLDFEEYLFFKSEDRLCKHIKNNNFLNKNLPETPEFFADRLKILWNEFLVYGGYPEITLENNFLKKKEKLKEISSTYITKDIKDIARIENLTAFNKLVYLLATQIGNLINIDELSSTLQTARGTLEKYLFLLENTFVIKRLPPFFNNPRKEISKMPKLFFHDTGIINSILNDFTPVEERYNIGHLVENAIFSQLWKKKSLIDSLNFWRTQTKSEIDFVFTRENKIYGIEVKAISLNKPKSLRNIESFKRHHPEYYKIIISNNKLLLEKNNYLYLTHYYL
jgi:hypothetical protein